MKKPIAAGSLFLGKFQVDYVLSDALKATRFGVPNSKEPVRITGWYKYKPGAKFTDMNMKEYPDRLDEASIYAVYYRNTDDNGDVYTLDGHDVEDLDRLLENPQVFMEKSVEFIKLGMDKSFERGNGQESWDFAGNITITTQFEKNIFSHQI